MEDEITQLKADEKESAVMVRPNYGWIGGAVLIGMGVIFLLQNMEIITLANWWALFLLIPAGINASVVWTSYRQKGVLDKSARNATIASVIFLILTSAFLFELNWDYIWPTFLILAGVAALWTGR